MEDAIQLSAEQTKLLKETRSEYVKNVRDIEALRQANKEAFEALFDKLGYGKEDGEKKKAIKKGFKLYEKSNADEEENAIAEAVAIAKL